MGTPTTAYTPGIIALLRSPPVLSIHFTAEDIRVTPHGYLRVADSLLSGTIKVEEQEIMPLDFDASYDADRNALLVKPATNLAKLGVGALVLHEMTHALVDLMHIPKSRGLHRTEGEGIAYIAQLLYIYFSTGNTKNIRRDLRLSRVADRISKRIVSHGHRMYVVSSDEMRELRNAIGQDPHYRRYRGQLIPSDG